MVNLDHGRLRKHGKTPLEKKVSSQMASIFQNIGGNHQISKGLCGNTTLVKTFQQILSDTVFPVLRWGL